MIAEAVAARRAQNGNAEIPDGGEIQFALCQKILAHCLRLLVVDISAIYCQELAAFVWGVHKI